MEPIFGTKDPTAYLLCGMYKSARMGCESVNGVIGKAEDRMLEKRLSEELHSYSGFSKSIETMMHERGLEPREPGMMAKMGEKAAVSLNMAIDPTASNIACVVVGAQRKSATMLENMCNEVRGRCDPKVMGLCEEMIDKERRSAKSMEEYIR